MRNTRRSSSAQEICASGRVAGGRLLLGAGPWIVRRLACVLSHGVAARLQQLAQTHSDLSHQQLQLVVRRLPQRVKAQLVTIARKDAIRDDGVEVHVEVERGAEALHEGHCTGLRVSYAIASRALAMQRSRPDGRRRRQPVRPRSSSRRSRST
jgi:hypothetical protein